MEPYGYKPLNVGANEIRILNLLPGDFDDDIRLTISHSPLIIPEDAPSQRMSLSELQESLPHGWTIHENFEGRYIFENESNDEVSWTHPDPNLDRARYEVPVSGAELDFEPIYEALSYVWGSNEYMDTAYIHDSPRILPSSDNSMPATLKIRRNLAAALRHLRYPDLSRALWIDAVCINQKDNGERGEQVGRMADIYRQADRVVVWLGPEENHSNLALSTLKYLGSQIEVTRDGVRLRSPECDEPQWFRSIVDMPYNAKTWHAITNLLRRSWFERLWVCQEIQLANSCAIIKCGHETVLWSHFRRAARCLLAKTHLPSVQLRELLSSYYDMMRDLQGRPLSSLISVTHLRECSDPRDKVYGILGISPPAFSMNIRPQYSLSVSAVYQEAFLIYLDRMQRLDLLEHCNLAGRRIDSPSWVPDWSTWKGTGISNGSLASGVSCAHAEFLPPDILEVIGVHHGTVRTVSHTAPSNISDARTMIRQWEPENLRTGQYVAGGGLLDAFVSTLRFGLFRDRFPHGTEPTLQEFRELFLSTISVSATGPIDEDILNDFRIFNTLDSMKGRSFITTEAGYIGLVPATTQPGK